MPATAADSHRQCIDDSLLPLREVLHATWGYEEFRPLQAEAMQSVLQGRDSVVVMPTGGGKSLCFQAPALHLPGLAVVVSPLISLMKDQVDALVENGVPAACVNSTLSANERRDVAEKIRAGRLKLLYLSPERLMTERTLEFLKQSPLSLIAIDEAHCISDWGHDFRPEYRMLARLKEIFPGVAIHAYTATATETVRGDIARQLRLASPAMLVGSFDRPNLIYRVQRRTELMRQIREVIDRHAGEAGIIYCIRRSDVEQLCASLCDAGLAALPYHAGMDDESRRRNQEAFINDRAQLIVATVAFGMGIDKSDVRFVIHAGAPKSLESYQQESGRAGRDGLEAECCLFFSGGDFQTWRHLQKDLPPPARQIAATVLEGIERFCSGAVCRHRAIVEYFGQSLADGACGACDVCLSEVDLLPDALVVAQKILSCVLRLKEGFGGEYTAQVLCGSHDQRIVERGHDKLSTWGLLAEHDKRQVRDWIEQLLGQQLLGKEPEHQTLHLTPAGRQCLRGELTPRLLKPAPTAGRAAKVATASWEGVDRELFETLRRWRAAKAAERGVPPFVVFSDATLRNLARFRPSTPDRLMGIGGIGQKKLADYGAELMETISRYCQAHGVATDVLDAAAEVDRANGGRSKLAGEGSKSLAKQRAMELFQQGTSIEDVARQTERARSTTVQYLIDFIEQQAVSDPTHWMAADVYERICNAAKEHGSEMLKPIFEALGGEVAYEEIRIALACRRNAPPEN
jgi:ATP-dependent DNA helicase RecQ